MAGRWSNFCDSWVDEVGEKCDRCRQWEKRSAEENKSNILDNVEGVWREFRGHGFGSCNWSDFAVAPHIYEVEQGRGERRKNEARVLSAQRKIVKGRIATFCFVVVWIIILDNFAPC